MPDTADAVAGQQIVFAQSAWLYGLKCVIPDTVGVSAEALSRL